MVGISRNDGWLQSKGTAVDLTEPEAGSPGDTVPEDVPGNAARKDASSVYVTDAALTVEIRNSNTQPIAGAIHFASIPDLQKCQGHPKAACACPDFQIVVYVAFGSKMIVPQPSLICRLSVLKMHLDVVNGNYPQAREKCRLIWVILNMPEMHSVHCACCSCCQCSCASGSLNVH